MAQGQRDIHILTRARFKHPRVKLTRLAGRQAEGRRQARRDTVGTVTPQGAGGQGRICAALHYASRPLARDHVHTCVQQIALLPSVAGWWLAWLPSAGVSAALAGWLLAPCGWLAWWRLVAAGPAELLTVIESLPSMCRVLLQPCHRVG